MIRQIEIDPFRYLKLFCGYTVHDCRVLLLDLSLND